MDQSFMQAFSEIVREQISRRNEIKVEGLGIFCFRHSRQFQKQFEDGRVVMMPPKDTITFIPE